MLNVKCEKGIQLPSLEAPIMFCTLRRQFPLWQSRHKYREKLNLHKKGAQFQNSKENKHFLLRDHTKSTACATK